MNQTLCEALRDYNDLSKTIATPHPDWPETDLPTLRSPYQVFDRRCLESSSLPIYFRNPLKGDPSKLNQSWRNLLECIECSMIHGAHMCSKIQCEDHSRVNLCSKWWNSCCAARSTFLDLTNRYIFLPYLGKVARAQEKLLELNKSHSRHLIPGAWANFVYLYTWLTSTTHSLNTRHVDSFPLP